MKWCTVKHLNFAVILATDLWWGGRWHNNSYSAVYLTMLHTPTQRFIRYSEGIVTTGPHLQKLSQPDLCRCFTSHSVH